MKSRLCRTAVCCLLLLLGASFAATGALVLEEHQRAWLERKTKLVFAGDSGYPPYTFVGSDGQARGIDVDVARAVGRALGIPVEFRMAPWLEAMRMVREGQADALAGMTHTKERSAEWMFAEPHTDVQYRLFVREDTQLIHDLNDLEGMRVGVGEGSLADPILRTNPRITVINYPREKAMQQLLDQDIIAYVGNWLVQSHHIQSQKIHGIKLVGDPIVPAIPYGMAVRSDQQELHGILNAALHHMRTRGELAAIQNKWFGELLRPPLISREHLRWLWISLGLLAGVVVLGMLRNWELGHTVRRKTARIGALRALGTGFGETHEAGAVLDRAMNVLEPLMKHETLFVSVGGDGTAPAMVRQMGLPEPMAADLHTDGSEGGADGGLIHTVLRTGKPVLANNMEATTRLVRTVPAEHGYRSAACLPIVVEGKTRGVFGVLTRKSAKYLRKEHDFYEAVAAELGIALENARLVATLERRVQERTQQLNVRTRILEADLRMAREVQMAMLPFQNEPAAEIARSNGTAPVVLRLYNRYNAARTVGGDFFDVLRLSPNAAGVFICDVMGQGARAALLTAILRTLLGELSDCAADTNKFLSKLNQRLMDVLKTQESPIFASALYAHFDLDRQTLMISNAGHPWPILLDKSRNQLESLGAGQRPGPALGLFRDAEFVQLTHPLASGQSVLMFTDGLYETCNEEGESFGMERVQELIGNKRALSTPQLLDGLIEGLTTFCGSDEIEDDVCLVAIEASRPG